MDARLVKFLSRNPPDSIKTPAYLYFREKIEENILIFKKFEKNNIDVFYAMKANNFSPIMAKIRDCGFGFDVASKQEIKHVLNLGVKPEKITFSAPSKKTEDIKFAASNGIKYYAFDSEEGLKKIMSFVDSPKLFARMAMHSKDAAFDLSGKFGMTEKYFKYLARKAKKQKWPISGITFHVGSQNTAISSWQNAFRHLEKLIDIAESNGHQITNVNLGGGIPVQYQSHVLATDYFVNKIINLCLKFSKKRPEIKFFVEPGRALVANTMVLITKIIDAKPYKHPPILIVDTGVFNGIIEPIEHFEYPIFTNHLNDGKTGFFRIAGFSCEGYDIINKKVALPRSIKVGDIVPILYAGAYTFVYKSFHMVPYPEIVEVNY